MVFFPSLTTKRSHKNPEGPRYACFGLAANTPDIKSSIDVVSYNIKYGKNISEAVRIIEGSRLHHADIFFLQEMDAEAVKEISHKLGYNYIYYPAAFHLIPKKDLGNAILTRWPIVSDKKILLPHLDPAKLQRIAVSADILINNCRVSALSVHLNVFSRAKHRIDQINTLVQSLGLEQKHCIIAGDFNTFVQSHFNNIYSPFNKAGFQHASSHVKWTYKYWYLFNKTSALDHIFTKGFDVVSSDAVDDNSASDHLPIHACLRMR